VSEKIQETLIHVLSATIAGGIAHFISEQSLEGREKEEMVGDVKKALVHAGVSVVSTIVASALVRRVA
jgi:hypothetical protein